MTDVNDIILDRVSKSYDGKPVLDQLSHCFRAGETTVIMGPSGCGKTTLLRLLLWLETADSGEIRMDRDVKIGCVFQEDRLIRHLSPLGNCRLVSERDASGLLKDLGLEDSMTRPVRKLSGGMARRVAIARALAANAELIVMDEPLKGLDEETGRRVLDVIRRETKGKTMLLVTHDPEEARRFGGELFRMETLK